ncbi:MlaD family protein [Vibrio nigripulchritudo]|uniref:MlaD family protein n=1 Tax=Vibrio nigripulchritudo TaxID=28173 RepID=UPI0003B1EF95|nr:MlaD family protein [Vibrio nigripulchritudo]CCN73684.1 putative Paraquat-inducible protein B [Vibrio nigripulchritudo SFn118]
MSSLDNNQSAHTPRVKRDIGISPLWLLPIITICLAGWLVVKAVNEAGQRIQIYFSDAQGLIAGRTTIRYQGLEVGMVRDIKLSPKLDNIFVEADIYPEATKLLSGQTRFWLVKPTASLSGISGLDALVSGNYIAIHPGASDDEDDDFDTVYTALENSPTDLLANQGLNIVLHSSDLGSISVGSQIVYKKIPIGEVYGYQLDPDGNSVSIRAFIEDEYRHLVSSESRFWNVSGIGANVGFDGVDVKVESLSAMLGGAIAVDSPDEGQPITEGAEFKLYPDLKTAGRGIPIQIELPNDNKVSTNGAPIVYRGIEIGQITDIQLSLDRTKIIAYASIQPSFADTLNTGTRFLLEEAEVSLTGIENIGNLVTGNFLTLVPGQGEKSREFTAIRKSVFALEKPGSLEVTFTSKDSFGLEYGTHVLYRGIQVGSIIDIELDNDQVQMKALIDAQYAHLIKSRNRFFVDGSAKAELTDSGISVSVPPAKRLLSGSISFISSGSKKPKTNYPLFASQSLAELAEFNKSGSYDLTLFSQNLPSVSKGAPLLYRNLQVGKVSDFKLTNGGVLLHLKMDNQYKHLLSKNTVFWNRSGIEVNADLNGVNIKAAPVKTLIQGGIAFDSLPGVENKLKQYWKLYDNYDEARKYGRLITLTSDSALGVASGMEIRYQGVPVGEVTLVTPNFTAEKVEIKARILPEFVKNIALDKSHFWLVQPEVGLRGVKNIETLLSKYIDVEPAGKKSAFAFKLHMQSSQLQGKEFQLQSERRNSISVGTPLLYRDMEVGRVIDVNLGAFADRIITTIQVDHQFEHLVRENTVFWNVSGVDVSIGITGAKIKAGTVDSLVRGGIAFATPDTRPLPPEAKEKSAFFLYAVSQPEWLEWRTPIPR